MYFELWDIEGRNLLEDFESLSETLQAAREYTAVNPGRYPEGLALAQVDENEKTSWPAVGAAIFSLIDDSPEGAARRSA
jgi:hypothetical protein